MPFVHFDSVRVAILANFPLHVIPSLSSGKAPTGHYATWLPPLAEANATGDGIERIWITLCDEIEKKTEGVFWNQRFIILPSRKTGRASSFFREDRAAIQAVLREIRPDLVHGWGTEDVYALAAVTSGFPAVISMQGILSHYVLHTQSDARMWFQALLELYLLRRTRALTCESRWARPILQRRAPRAEITCIEYGAHPDFFEATWTPDPANPAAIFVGTVAARKGIQDALKAFATPELKETELWVVGSGPLEDWENAPPNVKWLGRLDRARLIEKMSKAWCLVLPTRADTSPNVVKEGRVMGLPVVTTPCGGQSDYIEEGRNGFIVNPGDIANLTSRLHQLLSDFDFCRQRGLDGWEADRAIFRTDVMAEKFRALYREVTIL
ncbi:MAG: glycosyltransferase family 4 protein [Methylacidiphilales bacterium]|nr:glycosyltransferase family 4 protein [Candidatus Methylacidiphilales bacterium]